MESKLTIPFRIPRTNPKMKLLELLHKSKRTHPRIYGTIKLFKDHPSILKYMQPLCSHSSNHLGLNPGWLHHITQVHTGYSGVGENVHPLGVEIQHNVTKKWTYHFILIKR